ncbi:MAG: hypothetical protein WBL88_03110, partial [Nitrososphaeraceae archaeon]
GTICVGYPDEKPEKLGFFSNKVLAVRIQAIHYYEKNDYIGQFTSKRFSGMYAKMNTFYYSSTRYPILIALKHTGPQKGREVEKAV